MKKQIICLKCNKSFIATTAKKFCSKKCFTSVRDKNCRLCNKVFRGDYNNAYCSHDCRTKDKKSRRGVRAKFLETRLCKYCNIIKNYKDYREAKPLKKGPSKGMIIGWTDKVGKKRFNKCKSCERDRAEKNYKINPIPQMLSNSKIRAKEKRVPHTITTSDLKKIWPKDNRCPVLKSPFDMGLKFGRNRSLAPSLDKIIPKKGYVPGNIVIVSDIVNRVKSDATLDDMKKILDYYTKLQNK